ncbi:hypothetical protein HPP92_028807 [Vanilla planifolia]|uniref:Uncharacterized protein n=1 Tax=Vanilla planifolia TaxID=51239 RepID=A0A835P765_VANPL|nr:hypothetical protein HPP92_028807 [Vanilla planifolia]KAG0446507.1 hypothetical protein HPP92_028796 [Vanilla planifolia]
MERRGGRQISTPLSAQRSQPDISTIIDIGTIFRQASIYREEKNLIDQADLKTQATASPQEGDRKEAAILCCLMFYYSCLIQDAIILSDVMNNPSLVPSFTSASFHTVSLIKATSMFLEAPPTYKPIQPGELSGSLTSGYQARGTTPTPRQAMADVTDAFYKGCSTALCHSRSQTLRSEDM